MMCAMTLSTEQFPDRFPNPANTNLQVQYVCKANRLIFSEQTCNCENTQPSFSSQKSQTSSLSNMRSKENGSG